MAKIPQVRPVIKTYDPARGDDSLCDVFLYTCDQDGIINLYPNQNTNSGGAICL